MPIPKDAWQDYRRRRRRLIGAAAGGLVLLGLSIRVAGARHSGKPILAAFVLSAGATLFASFSLSAFPCPKCGKPFTYDENTRDGFTRACVHCQLPKWSDPT